LYLLLIRFFFLWFPAVTFLMSEPVTVERGVRDCFSPQNEQLPVRQSELGMFAGNHGMKKWIGGDIRKPIWM
jgi:hypothetical protein